MNTQSPRMAVSCLCSEIMFALSDCWFRAPHIQRHSKWPFESIRGQINVSILSKSRKITLLSDGKIFILKTCIEMISVKCVNLLPAIDAQAQFTFYIFVFDNRMRYKITTDQWGNIHNPTSSKLCFTPSSTQQLVQIQRKWHNILLIASTMQLISIKCTYSQSRMSVFCSLRRSLANRKLKVT